MEQRAHPVYTISTFTADGTKHVDEAFSKQELEDKIRSLLRAGKIKPGEFVVNRPVEGLVIKMDMDNPEDSDIEIIYEYDVLED